jgi:methyltransferase (TIGR00027 family)
MGDTMDAVGMTSRWVAAARARESARPDPLFDDALASALAGDEGWAMFEAMQAGAGLSASGENPYLAIRTRFFDDVLLGAARGGLAQIAILAAGMDTRVFRLPWPAGTTLFEVERPDVLAYKEAVLAPLGPKPLARRRIVAADLRHDWRGALAEAGLDERRPSAFLVEGLLPYLAGHDEAVALLSSISMAAPPGSILAFDLAGQGFLTSPFTQGLREVLARFGVPWRFGSDEPERLVAGAGFRAVKVVQPSEEGYGRFPYPVLPRAVPGVPRSYMVVADRDPSAAVTDHAT